MTSPPPDEIAAAPLACGVAEGLLAARASASLPPASECLLSQHLATCAGCSLLARELEAPAVADVLASAVAGLDDFPGLRMVDAENYVRGEEIDRSAMGRTVRARDRRLGRAVAIVELLDEQQRERFQREARQIARLQHPGIVSVHEAGCWPSGEAFYAANPVAGRRLDEVVAGMKSQAERAGLLLNLLTVVEAVAYAHRAGVVHGDLQQRHIVVGPFGETVVTGWGSAPPDADARSDVRALGAIFHHVLAGNRPKLPSETPRELRALVAKAMADRHFTAAELAGDLRQLANRRLVATQRAAPRGPVQRRRGLAILAAIAVAIAGAIVAVQVRGIMSERDVAEARRRNAEQLVDTMLGTLRGRLEPIGKLDVLAGVGRDVERYYAAVPAARANLSRALSLLLLADVDRGRGNVDGARAELEHVVLLCAQTATSEAAACTASALDSIGICEDQRGDPAAALATWRRAREQLEAALVRYPKDAALRRLRAAVESHVGGAFLTLGRWAQGRDAYRQGIQGASELVADDPHDSVAFTLLVTLDADLGDLELRDGNPEAATHGYAAAADLAGRQHALEPADSRWQLIWARATGGSAAAAILLADWGLARARLEPMLRVARRAVREDPEDPPWLSTLAVGASLACENDLASGRLEDATHACLEAETDLERLQQEDAGRETAAKGLASLEATLAALRLAQPDLGAARAAALEARAVAGEWIRRERGDRDWLLALSAAEWRLASVARAQGQTAEARAASLAALVAAAGIADGGDDLATELALARAQISLAEPDGEAELRLVVQRLARAAERWPSVVEIQDRLAQANVLLARIVAGRPDGQSEARALRERALAWLVPLDRRGALAWEFHDLAVAARAP